MSDKRKKHLCADCGTMLSWESDLVGGTYTVAHYSGPNGAHCVGCHAEHQRKIMEEEKRKESHE